MEIRRTVTVTASGDDGQAMTFAIPIEITVRIGDDADQSARGWSRGSRWMPSFEKIRQSLRRSRWRGGIGI